MCPDPQLLSAYYDEELDPMQAREVEEHIAGCTSCRERTASFSLLSADLVCLSVPDIEESQARSWQAIQARRNAAVVTIWQRRISIPMPVAAAAAAAIVLALGFSIFSTITGFRHGGAFPLIATSVAPRESPMEIQASNINDIINYLNSRELGTNVTMQLPNNLQRIPIGQPQLMRAVDFRRGQ